jgi:hypothetical protein
MRIIPGFCATALMTALLSSWPVAAQGPGPGGFGAGSPPHVDPPRQGIGVDAYAPGQGPVGVAAWNGGNWRGPVRGGFLPWGGGYAVPAAPAIDFAPGGPAAFTYNHFDNRRRDGGFYGGGGVFYGDDGYSRLPVPPAREVACPENAAHGAAAGAGRNGSPHVIELPETGDEAAPVIPRKPARRGAGR